LRGRPRPVPARLANPVLIGQLAAPAAAAALTLIFVVPTLAPGVLSWDTAEFQAVGPVLGTAHPTGYASYVILGWLASIVLQPFGDPAFRMNLLQALLAASVAGGAAAVVQVLTGRRFVALATGLMLAMMPFASGATVLLPVAGPVAAGPLFMQLATHADPHMFHVALTALLFVLLLVWDIRRHSDDRETLRHADRWLVAAACVYGVAVANHSLALLLPPAIGLFVLAADWRVVFRWRTILTCVAVLLGTIVVLFLELPIRAAMNAPLVYGHPDTWSGFQYVVLAEQFRGSLVDPFGDLLTKTSDVMALMSGWLGPLSFLAAFGFVTSLVRRPRYILLSGLSALITCGFAASYVNAEIDRYFLLPLLVAFTWAGLGAADLVALVGWMAAAAHQWSGGGDLEPADASLESTEAGPEPSEPSEPSEPAAEQAPRGGRRDDSWAGWAVLIGEMVVAAAIVVSTVSVLPARQGAATGDNPGGVSEAGNTYDSVWMHAVLAPTDEGGLPANSVIVSWWSTSTTLWYGQKVLGMRPDIFIVDDRTRLDDNLGEVQDVLNRFLGNRPVFAIRVDGGIDGIVQLAAEYDMKTFVLGDGMTISQVVRRKGSQ